MAPNLKKTQKVILRENFLLHYLGEYIYLLGGDITPCKWSKQI